jgi:hypothetical protein
MYKILLTVIILVTFSQVAIGQVEFDTVKTELYSDYKELTCDLRQELILALKSNDKTKLKQLRNTRIPFYSDTIQLYTLRENILLRFDLQEYDTLLAQVLKSKDYFSIIPKNDPLNPNFECGNLTIDLLDYWNSETKKIISNIKKSNLEIEEKDLLILYYKGILIYLKAADSLPTELSVLGQAYLAKYPKSKYSDFISKKFILAKKSYIRQGMTLSFHLGRTLPVGNISNNLGSNIYFDFDLGYEYNRWAFLLGGKLSANKTNNLISIIDTIAIEESTYVEYSGANATIGYSFIDFEKFRLRLFCRGELNSVSNYIELPNSTGTRQRGSFRPYYSMGFDGSLRLFKQTFGAPPAGSPYFYNLREEKDVPYDPLYLKFKVGYYPNPFYKATEINGGMFYFAIGLEYTVGQKKATYKPK